MGSVSDTHRVLIRSCRNQNEVSSAFPLFLLLLRSLLCCSSLPPPAKSLASFYSSPVLASSFPFLPSLLEDWHPPAKSQLIVHQRCPTITITAAKGLRRPLPLLRRPLILPTQPIIIRRRYPLLSNNSSSRDEELPIATPATELVPMDRCLLLPILPMVN